MMLVFRLRNFGHYGYTFTTTVVMVMLLRDFAPYGKIKLNTLIRQTTTLLLVIKDEALHVSAVIGHTHLH
jgi:hypothetical protein